MIRNGLVFSFLLALGAPANAQFSAYGLVTLDHLTGIQSAPVLATLSPGPCTGSVTTNCTPYHDSVDPIGFTGGATYDIKQVGPVLLSADVRGVIESVKRGAEAYANGSGTRIYSGLGGVKVSFHTPYSFLSPYVIGSAGYARSNYGVLTDAGLTTTGGNPVRPGVPTHGNLEYHAFAGLDLHLFPAIDVRAFELGYGGIKESGNYAHNYPLLSLSAGVVFHIPPRY